MLLQLLWLCDIDVCACNGVIYNNDNRITSRKFSMGKLCRYLNSAFAIIGAMRNDLQETRPAMGSITVVNSAR
jgi:hypothetical protein